MRGGIRAGVSHEILKDIVTVAAGTIGDGKYGRKPETPAKATIWRPNRVSDVALRNLRSAKSPLCVGLADVELTTSDACGRGFLANVQEYARSSENRDRTIGQRLFRRPPGCRWSNVNSVVKDERLDVSAIADVRPTYVRGSAKAMATDYLTLRSLSSTAVMLPMTRPLGTSAQKIDAASLLLVDLETHEGVSGRAYAFCYLPSIARSLVPVVAELSVALAGQPLVPHNLAQRVASHF